MQLFYENTDISADVDIRECRHRDVSGGRSDCLEIILEHADAWYRWGVRQGDRMRVMDGGYDTGELYLNTILPENGRYRILATSTPAAAQRTAYGYFEKTTIDGIMAACAAEMNAGYKLYGIDGGLDYDYILRGNEGCAAFLSRLLEMEGAIFKFYNGQILGIGIEYAQSLQAVQKMELSIDQGGVCYRYKEHARFAGITIQTPYAQAAAADGGANTGIEQIYTHLPAMNAAQAGRWARGLLLSHNRRAEELTIESELNTGFTAMARVDIESRSEANGEWIIDETEHDFILGRTTARLLRCMAL